MADGLCTTTTGGETFCHLNDEIDECFQLKQVSDDKTVRVCDNLLNNIKKQSILQQHQQQQQQKRDCVNETINNNKFCVNDNRSENLVVDKKQQNEDLLLDINMPSPSDDDCRKKRCVDRYDSSESSDSGVAILSCTDCSGSSTASSDITDPGSPFSTTSSHSEDSSSNPTQTTTNNKMPPTQNVHHPPWLWNDEQQTTTTTTKTTTLKRTSSSCNNNNNNNNNNKSAFQTTTSTTTTTKRVKISNDSNATSPKCLNNNLTSTTKTNAQQPTKVEIPKLQQGKITEYFKSQYKSNIMKQSIIIKTTTTTTTNCNNNKFLNQNNHLVDNNKTKKVPIPSQRLAPQVSTVSSTARTIPRKILPAPPTKQPEKILNVNNFQPIITTFIPNVTYIQTKAPKTFIPTLPSCINVLQPIQKISAFNCVKLNTTASVMSTAYVKLNMPPKSYQVINTALPTVITPTANIQNIQKPVCTQPSQQNSPAQQPVVTSSTNDDGGAPADCLVAEELSPADSGISSTNADKTDDAIIDNKSPILSQPKTLRFPPAVSSAKTCDNQQVNSTNSSSSGDTATCQWDQCEAQFDTNGALLEHLQVKHVISQATQEQYVCLWQGCKVHGRKSCSQSWLERHVLAHAGSKPFRCIVDGCGQRFNSQLALERHVNGHFNTDSTQNGSAKKSVENGSVKLFRRNGKKIRFRRQPWSARMFDFMDSGIMEGLQYKLLSMTEKRTMGNFDSIQGDSLLLHSQILARRVEGDGTRKMLVRWHPTNLVEDEWLTEKEYKQTKTVQIPKLQASTKTKLNPVLFESSRAADETIVRRKHRRKPCKAT